MANQVRDGQKELKQKCLQKENAVKNFNHTTSLKSIAADIHAFRKSCIHTPYMQYKQDLLRQQNRWGEKGEYPLAKLAQQTFLTSCLPRPLLVHYEQTIYSRKPSLVLYTPNRTNVTVLKYCNSYIFLSKRYFQRTLTFIVAFHQSVFCFEESKRDENDNKKQ